MTKSKNFLSFTTNELASYNDKITDITTNINLISNKYFLYFEHQRLASFLYLFIKLSRILNKLLQVLRKNFGCIYKLIECVSLIDMLQSFAYLAIDGIFTRPEFGDVLAIKESYHPVFNTIKGFKTVPNNVYAAKENSVIIITGSNMSGKSSYLKQVYIVFDYFV
jgi:DNA mismatch repair ATPase MutS